MHSISPNNTNKSNTYNTTNTDKTIFYYAYTEEGPETEVFNLMYAAWWFRWICWNMFVVLFVDTSLLQSKHVACLGLTTRKCFQTGLFFLSISMQYTTTTTLKMQFASELNTSFAQPTLSFSDSMIRWFDNRLIYIGLEDKCFIVISRWRKFLQMHWISMISIHRKSYAFIHHPRHISLDYQNASSR